MTIGKLERLSRLPAVSILLVNLALIAPAQTVTGRLLGTVQDPTQAGVPGARVTITNENTGISSTLQTDETGNYVALSLPPGTYTVRVEASGFQTALARGNSVNVAQTTRLDVTLGLGQLAQTMEVRSVAPLVQSTTSDVGEIVQQRQVQTLPLNGRVFLQLIQLTAGAVPAGQSGTETESSAAAGSRTAISANVNGVSNSGNLYTMDGVSNSEPGNAYLSIAPPVEAVEEFKVQTSNPSAEFGTFGGAVVNLTVRSGTNQFHGSLFEFLRNDKLNAKPFFASTKAPWKTNQFGGTLGGPIKRNKIFFFADYQGLRLREGKSYNLSVPTLSMQQGVLLQQEGFDIVYDPQSSSTPATRTPFANNTVPASRWDAVTRQVMGLWPQPNQSGTRTGPYQNFGINTSDAQTMNNFDVKGDYQFERRGRMFIRESYSKRYLDVEPPYNRFMFASPDSDARNHNAVFGYSVPLRPTMLIELRVGYNRFSTPHFGQDYPIQKNNELGIKNGNLPNDPQSWGIAGFSAGLSGFGAPGWTNGLRRADTNQLTNGNTWIRGSHTVKFGFDLKRFRTTNTNPSGSGPRGGFSFGRDMTSQAGRAGAEFASFLLGYPSSVSRSLVNTRPDVRVLQGGPYIQDDWRVNRSLTVNAGLRWDILTAPVEKYDRQTNFNLATFKFDKAVPGNRGPNADTYLRNFGPRFGLAYSPNDGRTAVRAAFGISYFNANSPAINTLLERNFPLYQTFSVGPTVSYVPFLKVDVDGLPNFVPTPLTEHIDPIPGLSLQTLPMDYRPAMILSWNAGIQQQLGQSGVAELSYVATRGTHLDRSWNINTPLFPGPGPLNDRRPYFSVLPLNQSVNLRDSGGLSLYNSLQAKYSRRFANGFQGLLAYTFAHSYDDLSTLWLWNDRMNWDASSSQPQHLFAGSWTYELPVGKGRDFLRGASTPLDLIVGGWSVNGIAMMRTGVPLSVSVRNNLLNTGTSNVANKTCPAVSYPKLVSHWFDTSCFDDPAEAYVWGDARRGVLWGPGVVNFDLAVFKAFGLGEERSLEFRAEFFNAFNNPHFSNPNTSRASGSFGAITSTSLPPREIQLGLKLKF